MAETTSPWLVAKGSVIGQGHIKHGLPCQDANALQLLPENPAWGVAVVSDGAGSCANSDRGSARIAVKASQLFCDLIRQQGWADGKQLPNATAWASMAQDTLKKVVDDLRYYAESQSLDFHSLSATIIVVVFGPQGLLVTNVGDGRAAAQRPDGSWQAIMTPYRGEEVNATVFLTSNIWGADRVEQFVGANVFNGTFRAFALLSDGCEMATFALSRFDEQANRYEALNEPYPPFFDPNVKALIGLHKQGKTAAEINQLWEQLLKSGTQRLADEPDDKTIILAVNLDLVGTVGTAPAPAEVEERIDQEAPEPVKEVVVSSESIQPQPVHPMILETDSPIGFTAPKQLVRNIKVQRGGKSNSSSAKKAKSKKHRR
ncbi:protein phosphatase 2C domain-containing protein [Hymenobacter sp. BT18]|uniref:PP2C family serine/threonine-protein phosphatase n=1 Tax=Hymenobacter sp. BT18 TaxID=2835648 RepID=UPI00143E3E61|nr:PP2C family serine/threonine-protein phosphatase [Hymenobacter sp. BT18]QIX62724.1 protein phosphatase 2C domain-containing protein [Hymenobacter sp. BT18]